MADPRKFGPQARSANLSELMQAKSRAAMGEKVNFCPFGCEDREVDEHGYCRHLVGFLDVGGEIRGSEIIKKSYVGRDFEPMRRGKGGRYSIDSYVITESEEVVNKYDKVQENDVLVRVTTSARVYREAISPKPKAAAKA